MSPQTLEAQANDERGSGRFAGLSDRDFWSALRWEVEAFPERYPDLIQQHRSAGLDPRDERYLDTPPPGSYKRPTTVKVGNRTVSID